MIWILEMFCRFCRFIFIFKCVNPNQFLLMSLDGKIYPFLIEEMGLTPAIVRTSKVNVTTLSELK